jgi:hypothetical protein
MHAPNPPRRPWALPISAGVLVATLVVLLAPVAAASSPGLVLHPRYPGAATTANNLVTSGCGVAKLPHPWSFSLRTGIGKTNSRGQVALCAKSLNGVGTASSAGVAGGFEAAIPLRIPSNSTSVTVSTFTAVTVNLSASDGAANNSAPAPGCTAGISNYASYVADHEWDWAKTTVGNGSNITNFTFHDYNDTSSYTSNGGSYNSTSGNAATPSPFHLNRTSSEYLSMSYGGTGSCSATASVILNENAYLVDETTGGTIGYSNTTAATFSAFLTVSEVIDWSCGYSFEWYGPSNYANGSTTSVCVSYNTSLTSTVDFATWHSGGNVTGTNNSVAWGFNGSARGTETFNGSFHAGHRYTLFYLVDTTASAADSWRHGAGTWSFDLASHGDEFQIASIAIL